MRRGRGAPALTIRWSGRIRVGTLAKAPRAGKSDTLSMFRRSCRSRKPIQARRAEIADFGLASSFDAEYISTPVDLLSFSHFVSIPPSGVSLMHFMEEIT